jgi:hypothetical protein
MAGSENPILPSRPRLDPRDDLYPFLCSALSYERSTEQTVVSAKPKAESLTYEEVVCRVRGEETALYEVSMRRYNRRLYRITRDILHSDTEAEDVMRDAYVRAYEHLEQFVITISVVRPG